MRIIKTLTLEIRDGMINMVIIQKYFNKIKYLFMSSFEFIKIDDSGIILDINNLSKIIKNKTSKFSCKNISFAIQNENVISRHINLINTSLKKDVLGLIKYELSEYMPINIDDYIIKYNIEQETEQYIDVQVILTPKTLIKSYKELARLLKLRPKNLCVNFDILNKLINNKIINLEGDKNVILDIGKKYTNINFIEGSFIKNSYTLKNEYLTEVLNNQIKESNSKVYYYGLESESVIKSLNTKFNLNKIHIENNETLNGFINNIGLV